MPRVVHFEIGADDVDRLSAFYAQVFGWRVTPLADSPDYCPAETGDEGEFGINGAIMRYSGEGSRVINTVQVPDMGDCLRRVESAGGRVVTGPDEVEGIGFFAYCEDIEGNRFGVMQPVSA